MYGGSGTVVDASLSHRTTTTRNHNRFDLPLPRHDFPSTPTNPMLSPLLVPAVVLLLLCCWAEPCEADTAGGWTLYDNNPVLGPGLGVIFDVSVLVTHNSSTGRPHYSMYNSWRSDNTSHAVDAIGLAQSDDGLTWSGQQMVLPPLPSSDSWEHVVNRASVIVNGSSGYMEMWYTGQSSNESFIGTARSSDGISWKRVQAKPVLSPWPNTWEKAAVMCPNVIYNSSLPHPYRLYYSGGEQYEPDAIGLATSDNGLLWFRHPSNPVLKPNATAPWESYKVTGAHVFYDHHTAYYYAFYIGFADVNTASINLARSADGVTKWQRHPANPIISRSNGTWTCDAVYKPYVVWQPHHDRWLLYFNGRCGSVEQIGIAIKKGRDFGFDDQQTEQVVASPPTSAPEVDCFAAARWSLAVTSLQPWESVSRYVVLRSSCQLVTIVNSCSQPDIDNPCWDYAIGVDLRTGRVTFNTSLADPSTEAWSSQDSTEPLQLSSSGQLVYWTRLLLPKHQSPASSPPHPTAAPAQSCGEVVALQVDGGDQAAAASQGNVAWRYRTCSNASVTFADLLVFPALAQAQQDDVLLIMQTTEDGWLQAETETDSGQTEKAEGEWSAVAQTPTELWRSVLGSSGQLLHDQPDQLNGTSVWNYYINDADTGHFTLATPNGLAACLMQPDGTWSVARLYSQDGPEPEWTSADEPQGGSALLQHRGDLFDWSWRGVDRLTGDVLWQQDTDESPLNKQWVLDQFVLVSLWSGMEVAYPSLYMYKMGAYSWGDQYGSMWVYGYIDRLTGQSIATEPLGPWPYTGPTVPPPADHWLDKERQLVAVWLNWRWLVLSWPSMSLLAYGDVNVTAEYGVGYEEVNAMPTIVSWDSVLRRVHTVMVLSDRLVGVTYYAANSTSSSSSSSSSASALPHASSSSSAPLVPSQPSSSTGSPSSSNDPTDSMESRFPLALSILVLLVIATIVAIIYVHRQSRQRQQSQPSTAAAAEQLLPAI